MREQSVVFRQLERGSRLSRFDLFDGVIVLLSYNLHFGAALVSGGNLLRPYVTLAVAAVGVWFLRARFPDGVGPLLQVLTTPRQLSGMAPDLVLDPYPAATASAAGAGAP